MGLEAFGGRGLAVPEPVAQRDPKDARIKGVLGGDICAKLRKIRLVLWEKTTHSFTNINKQDTAITSHDKLFQKKGESTCHKNISFEW